MGGFAGGDEAGYWDIDTPFSSSKTPDRLKPLIEQNGAEYSIKAHAKIEIDSNRWVRSHEFDIIRFIPSLHSTFTLEGCDAFLHSHPIYLAYQALVDTTNDPEIEEFFCTHKVIINEIASVGSSSHAAAFLHLAKEVCNLILSTDELAKIGSAIAPDMPFFIYNYPSVNVSDTGEIIDTEA